MAIELFLVIWLLGALAIFVVQVINESRASQRNAIWWRLLLAFCWPLLAIMIVLGLLLWLPGSLLHICRKLRRL